MQKGNSQKPRSISRTFSAGLIITLVLVAGLSLGVNFFLSSRKAKAELETRLEEYTSALTDALKVPLWTFSEETIEAISASYAQNEFIAKLIVEGEDGAVLFEKEKSDQALVVSKSKDIFYDANRVGRLHISLASGYYTTVNRQLFQSVSLTIFFMIGALLVMTGVLLRQFFKKPMSRFIEMVEEFAAGDSRAFKQGTSYSEFRPLVDVLDEMGEKIESQMKSIRQLNEDLERRVEERTEALKKLSEAVEQSPVTVVITDKNGTIEYVNPEFSAVTGYSAKEAIGQKPSVLKSGNFPDSFYKSLWDTILSGKTWRGEFLNRKKNDEEFWESASISPIKNDEGEITHFVAVKQDITEKKLIEDELVKSKQAAEDANKAKSEFLANMSHEIRTPMNAVIGMAHLALKTELTAKQRDYVGKIQSSANSLLGIINDILDFSKIEAGKLDIEAVEFDLLQTLDNVANVVTVKAQEKENLEVLFYVDSRVPSFLIGDPLRLNQILVNLGNNAVKFTEHGEIVLSTRVKSSSEDKITLQFSVRDTGLGMTAAQQTKLFEAFSQADTSTTRKFGGTGLGLTISKRLVKMMGGDIWVESDSGRGTTFSFTAAFGLGKEMTKKRFMPSTDLRGTKVLVVDDNATSREILQEMLESFSFSVTVAASGPEGIAELENADENAPFELVVMDWKMPGMDGIEASKLINGHPGLSTIPPIILATAYGFEEVMLQAKAVGLAGFLLKPINPSTLFDTIMQAFGEAVPEGRQVAPGKDQDAKAWKNIQGSRVLLVEDNEINQQVAMEILQGAGIDVTVANNGREGVDAAKTNPYDAILMDIQMPVMDGYTATRKIREWESGSRKWESGSGNAECGSWKWEIGRRRTKRRR